MGLNAEMVYGSLKTEIDGVATGFKSATSNADGTITVTFVNGSKATTKPIKGDKGDKGEKGDKGDSVDPTELDAKIKAEIDAHKDELIGKYEIIRPNINGYVQKDGAFSASASAKRTDYIRCEGFYKISYGNRITSGGYALGFYDADKKLMKEISIIGDSTAKQYITDIPADAKYLIYSCYGERNFDSFIILFPNENSYVKYNSDNNISLAEISTFGLFQKFGVIGDSLSVGCYADKKGTMQNRNIEYSWGRQLAKRLGTVCLNFGLTGVTTRTWLEQNVCKGNFIKPENQCQAYIIGLGANDSSTASYGLEVGSIADVDFSNMDNNADTFYGNYAKIIDLVNRTYPMAHIFIFTMPYSRNYSSTKSQSINNAIRELANDSHFKNVHLLDNERDYGEFYFLVEHDSSSHYSPLNYIKIAMYNGRILSRYIEEHYDDFLEIPKIPYGSATIVD